MSGSDQYSMTTVGPGSWSAAVQYTPSSGTTPGTVLVPQLGSGSVALTGSVSATGNTVQATFEPVSVQPFVLTLSAVCDIAGGAVFTDGSAYYLFSSGTLSAGATYATVSGFGAFSEALAPPVCVAAGTRIQTTRGPVLVEALRLSDRLVTASGAVRQIRWVGRQRVPACRFAPPSAAWPVRVAAHAFGAGRPAHALLLSPNHAVVVGQWLVPVRLLVNDASVRSVPTDVVDYYHVELESHDLMLAENLPVETYLDQDHRGQFQSLAGDGAWVTGTQRSGRSPGRRQQGRTPPLMPYADEAMDLRAVRARLLQQAIRLGYRFSRDAQLRLATSDGPLSTRWDGVTARAELPAAACIVLLLSETAVPSRQAASEDHRFLGAAVRDIRAGGRRVALDDPGLYAGWYAPESNLRWTNGHGYLRLPRGRARRSLTVETAPMLRYWQGPPASLA